MDKTCLIFGGGSKFGLSLTQALDARGHRVYPVSSSPLDHANVIPIDWHGCDFVAVERLLKDLPEIDAVIFNQNYCQIPESINLHTAKLSNWQEGRHWMQAHFVNSILPYQVLNSLTSDRKFNDKSVALWMLSNIVHSATTNLIGYRSQKTLNRDMIRSVAANNPGRYVGLYSDGIDDQNRRRKAELLADFISNGCFERNFYRFDQDGLTAI